MLSQVIIHLGWLAIVLCNYCSGLVLKFSHAKFTMNIAFYHLPCYIKRYSFSNIMHISCIYLFVRKIRILYWHSYVDAYSWYIRNLHSLQLHLSALSVQYITYMFIEFRMSSFIYMCNHWWNNLIYAHDVHDAQYAHNICSWRTIYGNNGDNSVMVSKMDTSLFP